jgi:hypothetical protein
MTDLRRLVICSYLYMGAMTRNSEVNLVGIVPIRW